MKHVKKVWRDQGPPVAKSLSLKKLWRNQVCRNHVWRNHSKSTFSSRDP